MSGEEEDEELNPSRLGTKEHWECCYANELENYCSHGDDGEIWFGKKVQKEVVDYVSLNIADKNIAVMDIGCGNAMLLVQLALRNNFTNLLGFDYSENAVSLAEKIVQKYECENVIKVFVADFLSSDFSLKCDVALDKGTFDAISLMPHDEGRPYRQEYKQSLISSLKDSTESLKELKFNFVITSCNWTEEELSNFFAPEFIQIDSIKRSSFSFGGAVGQSFSTVVFKLCS